MVSHFYYPIFLRKITDGVMKRGPVCLSLIWICCYCVLAGCRHTTEHEEVSGGVE